MKEQRTDILVIDDNNINLRLLHDMLMSQGYSVTTAESGLDGIEQAELLNPKLVLLDVQMPSMDGKEVLKRLRRHWDRLQLEPLPIIAVTALAMSGDEQKLLECGFNAYISKPVRLKTLIESVTGFIGKASQTS